jgi:sterol desaturase/sphingolipid hydroxylase (fatty acid hydroxylase superfamily)
VVQLFIEDFFCRFLYSKIHKKHHEWQATVAYAAIYAHPIGKTVKTVKIVTVN